MVNVLGSGSLSLRRKEQAIPARTRCTMFTQAIDFSPSPCACCFGLVRSKFACIRAWCTMEVPAEAIAELFESSERVKEYNK